MNEFFIMVQGNLEAVLLAADGLLLILSVIALHKISRTKRMIDRISGDVGKYLTAVMSEESIGSAEPKAAKEPAPSEEEEQNRLISAVLQEIFP
jgi:hypothetical protein